MKTFQLSSTFRALAFAMAGLAASATFAQETKIISGPATTGAVVAFNQKDGTIAVRSNETGKRIIFYGMDKAQIETSDGKRSSLADVRADMPITIYYTPQGDRWFVGRVIVPAAVVAPAPVPAAAVLTPSEVKALNSKAANDGDITTNPGVKARIDNDITTKPGTKDPADPDITKKEGN